MVQQSSHTMIRRGGLVGIPSTKTSNRLTFFTIIQIFILILLTGYQLFHLNFQEEGEEQQRQPLTGNTQDNNNNAIIMQKLCQDDDKEQIPPIKSYPPPPTPPPHQNNSFASCLLVMDDNHLLIEWLAYHYTILPLHRLIVGIDPRSQTQPTTILNRYRKYNLMSITEWQEEDFMPPHLINYHTDTTNNNNVIKNDTNTNESWEELKNLYIERQVQFYTKCMAYLKHEQYTWTAIIDTDEYILPNIHAENSYNILPVLDNHNHNNNSNNNNKKNVTDIHSYPTIYNLIERNKHKIFPKMMSRNNKGCISMHRLQFGTKDSTNHQVQKGIPPLTTTLNSSSNYNNGTNFITYRYRYHAGYTNKEYNKVGKCMIDVSQIPNNWFIPTIEVNAHRPIKSMCSELYLRIENRKSPFVTYHYTGSWEQWNYRDDFRPKRIKSNFMKYNFTNPLNQDDSIRSWVSKFTMKINNPNIVSELLQKIGEVPPKKKGKYSILI